MDSTMVFGSFFDEAVKKKAAKAKNEAEKSDPNKKKKKKKKKKEGDSAYTRCFGPTAVLSRG